MGHQVTEQSDVYSLGVVLFEMLTGEIPFKAETQVAVAMKHVREPMPDLQRRRPEVSSALAAALDDATAKETGERYASIEDFVHDLEESLAIEVARSGESGGEATSVLRALPGETADFVPVRLRNPRRWLVTVGTILLLAGGAVAYFATRTERGAGPAATPLAGGLARVELSGDAAMDYDPQGDEQESSDATRNAIDGNRTTIWDTESYKSDFQSLGKDGVGLYVDAGSPVAGRRLALTTPTPGFTASVYAANRVPGDIDGWRKVSDDATAEETTRIKIDTLDKEFRYYLLWITSLGEEEKAEIQEMTLFR